MIPSFDNTITLGALIQIIFLGGALIALYGRFVILEHKVGDLWTEFIKKRNDFNKR